VIDPNEGNHVSGLGALAAGHGGHMLLPGRQWTLCTLIMTINHRREGVRCSAYSASHVNRRGTRRNATIFEFIPVSVVHPLAIASTSGNIIVR
jgi:hypothetical protein